MLLPPCPRQLPDHGVDIVPGPFFAVYAGPNLPRPPFPDDAAKEAASTDEVAMARYYVNNNAQANGDHEVHELGCSFMPEANRTYLGEFRSCGPAVTEARKHHRQVNGCFYCSRPCHTQ